MEAKFFSALPELEQGQSFSCDNGCGECKPEKFDHVYREQTRILTGEKVTYSEPAYRSDCCGAKLLVWDENKQDFVTK